MATDQIHIDPAFEPLLARYGLTDVASIMGCDTLRPTRRHKTRSTAPIVLENGGQTHELHLKRVFRVPWKHIVADLLRGRVPQAQPIREWRAIERLTDHRIGVTRPVACGQRRWFGLPRQAFLLVEAVPVNGSIALMLARWIATADTDRAATACRHTMLVELGAFIRRLHDTQLTYPDLTGEHVFIKPAEGHTDARRWDFSLIDVERLSSTSNVQVHRRELRHLLTSLDALGLSTTDLLRFAVGYVGGTNDPWPRRKDAVCRAFDWTRNLLNQVRTAATRRPRRSTTALHPLEGQYVSTGRVVVSERFASALQQHGLGGFRSVFKYDGGRRLEKARLASWRDRIEVTLPAGDGRTQTLYLKRFIRPPYAQQCIRMLTLGLWHSTAWWEWRQIQRLRRAGIPTMVPVAFGEKLRGCFERRSFLVTEAVPGQSLERWVPARLEVVGTPGAHATAAAARRRDLISQLARLVAALHGAGLVHRDLYLSHIFVSFDDAGRSLLHLIDLTRVFRPRWRRSRWIVKDLAALNFSSPAQHVSQTDRVRFLRAYLRCDKLDTHAKTLARRIAAKTRRMARHNRDTVNVASDERRNDAAPVAGATRPS